MKTRSKTTGRRTLLGVSSIFIFASAIFSQGTSYDQAFVRHLMGLRAYEEGIYVVEKMLEADEGPERLDSLNYLLGKLHYYDGNPMGSSRAFNKVHDSSPFVSEAALLSSYQQFYLGNFDEGLNSLRSFSPSSDLMDQTVLFEEAGVSLLQRDLPSFDQQKVNFNRDYRQMKESQLKLEEVAESIRTFKPKSPFVAATLSALVPGSGRMYYGKIGQGIIVLFAHSIFAVQSIEGYRKDGPRSARFIIFTSLFSGFYIANIWGSALGVKIRRDEFNEQTDHTLLVTMHVPLRFLFD